MNGPHLHTIIDSKTEQLSKLINLKDENEKPLTEAQINDIKHISSAIDNSFITLHEGIAGVSDFLANMAANAQEDGGYGDKLISMDSLENVGWLLNELARVCNSLDMLRGQADYLIGAKRSIGALNPNGLD